MARPPKEGLEYFPHDVYASSDEKIEPLILLYGSNGYAFYFIHLEYIYRNKDLEFDISDAETREVIQQKLHISADEYNQILQTALKKKLFNPKYFDETGKLTSNGIKKRASSVFEKREKMRLAYERKVSASETTHIKKSKVKKKESKVINKEDEEEKISEGEIFNFFNENINPISPHQAEVISNAIDIDNLAHDLILEILKDSLGKRDKWSWVKRVIDNCYHSGVKSLQQYKLQKAEKVQVKSRDAPKQTKTVSFADLAKEMQENDNAGNSSYYDDS